MVIVKLECQKCETVEVNEGISALVAVKKENGNTVWLTHEMTPEEVVAACEIMKFRALQQLYEGNKKWQT